MSTLRVGSWTAISLAVFFLVIWPLVELAGVAAESTDLGGVDPTSVANTLLVGVGVSLVATIIGVAIAIATERYGQEGRRLLAIGVTVPILIPPFVSAMSFLRAYGPGGYLDDLIGQEVPGMFGVFGIIVVIAVNALPLSFLITLASLRTQGGSELEMASRVSGAGPLMTAVRVTVPLLKASIMASVALVFVVAINAFGVPAVMGTPAGFDTMTTSIYQDLALSARPEAFSRAILTAIVLVAIALVFVVIAETILSRSRVVHGGLSSMSLTNRQLPWWLRIVLAGFVLLVVVGPLLALVATAFTRGVGLAPSPENLTLGNFREAVSSGLLPAIGRSVLLSVGAASTVVLLGLASASLRPGRGRRWASRLSVLGFAIPGSTLAVAFLLAYGPALRDTLLLIAIAYVAKLWAVGTRAIEGSRAVLGADLSHAARASGASEIATIRTITIPMLRPAIAAGWFLVFLFAFHEVTMSSLLYGPGSETLAVEVLNVQQLGDVPVSSALALILTVPFLLLAVPFARRSAGAHQ